MHLPLLLAALIQPAPEAAAAPRADPVSIGVMAAYARCAARADPRRAAAIVLADADAPSHDADVRRFAMDQRGCVPRGGQLRFGALAFTGGMAEELLRARRVDAPALRAASAAATTSTTGGFGACVVRKAPDGVAALLATRPASAAEAGAIAGLRDTLPGCVRTGTRLVMNPVALRAMLALAGYRMVAAAAPAG